MRHLIFSLAIAALTGSAILPGSAIARDGDQGGDQDGDHQGGDRGGNWGGRSVPEFDPATVGAITAVVAGGGVLIARRRRR